jgi:hypothetical protein
VPRALDVAGAIDTARALLAIRPRFRWSDLLDRNAEAWQVLSVLLALLELARLGECSLRQPSSFGGIEITAFDRAVAVPRESTTLPADEAGPLHVADPSPHPQLPEPSTPSPHHDTAGAAA